MMKKSYLKILLLFSLIIISCSDNDDQNLNNNLLQETPEAHVQFNSSNFGIYKGVFVGSSGIVIVNVNNDNSISVSLTIDGVNYPFTSNEIIQENQQTEINFINGNNSFTFSVLSNGIDPQISDLSIEGHPNATIILVKETSNSLAELFEGTYAGTDGSDDGGTFNAIVIGTDMYVLANSTAYDVFYTATGAINGNSISGATTTGTNFTGIIDGNDDMSGTWTNTQSSDNGTWSLIRTY